MKWIVVLSFMIYSGSVLADACAIPMELSDNSGCACNFSVYKKELSDINSILTGLRSGNSTFSRSTLNAWGVNPCDVSPLHQGRRYSYSVAFLDGFLSPFRGGAEPCRNACDNEPWKVRPATWSMCESPEAVSYCTYRSEFVGNLEGTRCVSHGNDYEACHRDPFCRFNFRTDLSQSECEAHPNYHQLQRLPGNDRVRS